MNTARHIEVRNLALVGPHGAGKTAFLQEAARAADGAYFQHREGISFTPLRWNSVALNLLEAPAHPDFTADVHAALRAADAVIFVISALDGVDLATSMLWEECVYQDLPRCIVISHVDHPRADFEETVAICQRLFGEAVVPAVLPVFDDEAVDIFGNHQLGGTLSLLSQQIVLGHSGERHDAEVEHRELIADTREILVEAIVAESDDDDLIDRHIDQRLDTEADVKALERALAIGFHNAAIFPVLPIGHVADTDALIGVPEVLNFLSAHAPAPEAAPPVPVHNAAGDPIDTVGHTSGGPLLAEVLNVRDEEAIVRVYSGVLNGQVAALHSAFDEARLTTLASPDALYAGEISRATLPGLRIGDTLSAPNAPLLLAPLSHSAPRHPVWTQGVEVDELRAIWHSERGVHVEPLSEPGSAVVWCSGETHLAQLFEQAQGAGLPIARVDPSDVSGEKQIVVRVPAVFAGRVRDHLRTISTFNGKAKPDGENWVRYETKVPVAALATYLQELRKLTDQVGYFELVVAQE